jgi:hypothetical protein
MNKVFDYNGTFVSASKPVKQLRTVKKTFMIDSADRDTVKYYTNGDFVVYLPRVYENVVSLRLMAAEFPLLVGVVTSSGGDLIATNFAFNSSTNIVTVTVSSTSQLYINETIIIYGASNPGNNITTNIVNILSATTFTITNSSGATASSQTATVTTTTPISTSPLPAAPAAPAASTHSYSAGQNIASSTWSASPIDNNVYYFLIDIEGLNKVDECAVAGNRSSFPDSYYAKIPVTISNNEKFIEYNDHSGQDNISRYSPAIGKLDRMHIRTRLHSQQGNRGFIYWTTDGAVASGSNHTGAEFSLTFEIEYLDNVFDDFSSLETRIGERV